VQVLAADGVQVTAQVHPAVEAAGHGEPAAGVGRVVERAVGVDPGHPTGYTAGCLVGRRLPGQIGQDVVGLREVDPGIRGLRDPSRGHGPGDHPRMGGGDRTAGEGGGSGR
jgi:hypothetical protein